MNGLKLKNKIGSFVYHFARFYLTPKSQGVCDTRILKYSRKFIFCLVLIIPSSSCLMLKFRVLDLKFNLEDVIEGKWFEKLINIYKLWYILKAAMRMLNRFFDVWTPSDSFNLVLYYSCLWNYRNGLLYKLYKRRKRQISGRRFIWMDLWYWLGNSGFSSNWINYFHYWLFHEILRRWSIFKISCILLM